MTDNIRSIPNQDRDKLIAALEHLKRTAPLMIQLSATMATIRKASFDAHVAAGFTPEQALVLCTRMSE